MANIRPNQLPPASEITNNDRLIIDQGGAGVNAAPPKSVLDAFAPIATQSEAEAGQDNEKRMTPLRAQQHLLAQGVPNTRSVIAGEGLTGGGTLEDNRTLALSSDSIASLELADSAVQPSREVNAGEGLVGGGDLTANRNIALSTASISSLAKADTALQAPGGVAGQILAKASNADNDVDWVTSEAATAVSYGPQELTEEQQAQARDNIDSSGNLSELAKLTLDENKVLTTDADGEMTLSPVTSFSLTMLTKDSPLAAREALLANGNLFKVSYVTASGGFTYDPETTLAEVILIGGGGSGGGAGSGANNQTTATGGGGAAGMAIRLIESPSGTASIVIGSGGAAVSGSGGLSQAGYDGGASSYTATDVVLTAFGGKGAPQTFGSQNVVAGAGGLGGGATGGHLNITGQNGGGSISIGANALPPGAAVLSSSGDGGHSAYGVGGAGPKYSSAAAGQGVGVSGEGYGSGGSGSGRSLIVGNSSSGAGAPGICIIKEYK